MSTHQLQVTINDVWKTVLSFDGSHQATTDQVLQSVQMLDKASSSSQNWRIVSTARPTVALARMGSSTYGIWVKNEGP